MHRIILILLATLAAAPALGSTHDVTGKVTYCCAGSWSTVNTQFRFHYDNAELPTGSLVLLRFGLTDSEFRQGQPVPQATWQNLTVVPMVEKAEGVYELTLEPRQTYSRGGSHIITAINYVFEIRLPDGETLWDKGGDSAWGYYEAPTPQSVEECFGRSGIDCALPTRVIDKN